MADIRVRKRKRLRNKEAKALADAISADIGVPVFGDDEPVDRAESSEYDLIFVGNDILGLIINEKPMLTLRGVLKYLPQKRFVTVDMGAVPFIANGADCMGPGIVDADPEIKEGDFVWIRDIKNLRPLAVGISSRSGTELLEKKTGKAIKTLNSVGDKLWKAGE
ncbi:putative RNA-binding protein (contains PUA domain) [Thermoplasmatales archaeon BRNA1]|nr:putative RNA-binding protein (contains PUA domain) [Thermoplasmatales archaeon BRNA1]